MGPVMWSKASGALISAGAALQVSLTIMLTCDLGPQARHMGLHIVAMNIVAPAIAGMLVAYGPARDSNPSWLWIATGVQIAAVWIATHHRSRVPR